MEKIKTNSELEKLRELALKEIMQLNEEECELLQKMQELGKMGRAS